MPGTTAEDTRELGSLDGVGSDGSTPDTDAAADTHTDQTDPNPSSEAKVTDDPVKTLKAQIRELNSRIGKLVQANDARAKELEKEWTAWGRQYQQWAQAEVETARQRGKEDAEDRLLPLLPPEDKAKYYDGARMTEKERREQSEAARRSQTATQQQVNVALQAAINSAIAQNIPVTALDTSSPEAVMTSVIKYLTSVTQDSEDAETKVALKQLRDELAESKEEIERLRGDFAGESRVGTSVGGTSPQVNKRLEALREEMDRAKRRHNTMDFLRAKREYDGLLKG